MHVIGTHNMGYLQFYTDVLLELGIIHLDQTYLRRKQERKISKQVYDKLPSTKRARAFKMRAKVQQEIYDERTKLLSEGEYGHGIRKEGAVGNSTKRKRASPKKNKSPLCTCGGEGVTKQYIIGVRQHVVKKTVKLRSSELFVLTLEMSLILNCFPKSS